MGSSSWVGAEGHAISNLCHGTCRLPSLGNGLLHIILENLKQVLKPGHPVCRMTRKENDVEVLEQPSECDDANHSPTIADQPSWPWTSLISKRMKATKTIS